MHHFLWSLLFIAAYIFVLFVYSKVRDERRRRSADTARQAYQRRIEAAERRVLEEARKNGQRAGE